MSIVSARQNMVPSSQTAPHARWLNKGLVAAWMNCGSVVRDIVSQALPSSSTGVVVPSSQGVVTDYSGTQNTQFAHRPEWATTGAMTLIVGVQVDAFTNYTQFIAKEAATTANVTFEFRCGAASPTDGNLALIRASSGGGYTQWASSGASSAAGRYVNAVRADGGDIGAGTTVTMWQNGVSLSVTRPSTGWGNAGDTGSAVWVARRFDAATQLDGRIEFIYLFNRALSNNDIVELSFEPGRIVADRSIWIPVSAPASGGTGTLAKTLDALTSSATGELAISGSAAVTLGALTSSATGTLAITGSASVTLGPITSAATGVHDTISGSASITLDALTSSATGALAISGTLSQTLSALTVSAYENAPAPAPAASSPTPAGRAIKRRYVVEIDGETFDVASPTEAVAVLEQARETAKEQAAQAMQRAAKAQKRPVRKVIADARKALPIPQITVPETLKPAAQVVLEQIQTMYAQTMRDIEVAARMAHEQRIRDLEDDDEDVLLLL